MKSKKFFNCLKKNFFNLKVKLDIENTISRLNTKNGPQPLTLENTTSRLNTKNGPQPLTKEQEIIENPSSEEHLNTSRIHNKGQLSRMYNLKY